MTDEHAQVDLLAEEPTDYDVLLAPHHGSRRSNPPGLAAWSTPEWVVISGGSVILRGMPELAEQVFDLPVRRGAPREIGGLVDIIKGFRMTAPAPEPQAPPPLQMSSEGEKTAPGAATGVSAPL